MLPLRLVTKANGVALAISNSQARWHGIKLDVACFPSRFWYNVAHELIPYVSALRITAQWGVDKNLILHLIFPNKTTLVATDALKNQNLITLFGTENKVIRSKNWWGFGATKVVLFGK